jgi:hypothetical protein
MQHPDCPGRQVGLNAVGRAIPDFGVTVYRASARSEMAYQLYEKYDKTGGADLSISEKILRCGRLSGRMYKIRTLLSTDIVDNVAGPAPSVARKPLLHAARDASRPCVWHGGR